MVQGVEKGAKLIRHYGINVSGEQFVALAFEFAAAYASVKVSLSLCEAVLMGRFCYRLG